jgi:hypothetical protein
MPNRDDILVLSDNDFLDVRALCEGTLITGAPGSGKTTTSGRQLAYGLLRIPNSGGVILTAKAEETQNWSKYAKACGREKDLIVFNAESEHRFDPLHYEFSLREGRGVGDMESIIDLFSTLCSIGTREVGHGHDPFGNAATSNLSGIVLSCSISPGNGFQSPASIGSLNRSLHAPMNTRKQVGRSSRTARNSSRPLRLVSRR